jgi:hypothetical protein
MKRTFLSMMPVYLIVLPVFLLPSAMVFPQIDLQGFVDTYHSVRLKSPNDFLSSRNRLRLEMMMIKGNASVFTSVNFLKHHTLSDQSGIVLREAYIDYTTDRWDLRIGRQIIIWGKADGVQVTDVISPMDYTEFLARDYDDVRMPVDAVKFRILKETFNIELVWVPIFQEAVLPGAGNPWAVSTEFPENVAIEYGETLSPKSTLKNGELGGKLSFYLKGVDFSFSAMHTWDKSPALRRQYLAPGRLLVRPEHHRLTFFGFDFSLPLGDYVVRGETAYSIGKHLETADVGLLKKNTLKWLLGVDWYPGDGWNVSVQVTGTEILDYETLITDESHTYFATLNFSKKLLRETLTLSTFAYVGLNRGEMFNRCSAEYAINDGLHLSLGVDLFLGSNGLFGQYKDNSEAWIKAKYSF